MEKVKSSSAYRARLKLALSSGAVLPALKVGGGITRGNDGHHNFAPRRRWGRRRRRRLGDWRRGGQLRRRVRVVRRRRRSRRRRRWRYGSLRRLKLPLNPRSSQLCDPLCLQKWRHSFQHFQPVKQVAVIASIGKLGLQNRQTHDRSSAEAGVQGPAEVERSESPLNGLAAAAAAVKSGADLQQKRGGGGALKARYP